MCMYTAHLYERFADTAAAVSAGTYAYAYIHMHMYMWIVEAAHVQMSPSAATYGAAAFARADFLHISSTASCTSHHAMYARTVPAICKTCTCTRARHPGRSPTCQTCTGPGLAGNMQNNMHSFGNLEDMFIHHADNGVPCNDMCNHTA